MKITFRLVDSDSDIQKQILNLLKDTMDKAFKQSLPKIKHRVKQEVKDAIVTEPEYQSLIGGKLKYEFGIPSSQKIESIIDIWINNITINYSGIKIGGRGLSGSLSLGMIRSSYDDVLANDGATVVDSQSGAVLPWLEWLLLYGGKIIVRDYKVQIAPNSRSRTGMAIMVQSGGSNWRVPPEFAGTASNNWITRALDKIDSKITDILEEELEKAI